MWARLVAWQGLRGSNPRPTVLETVALPTELNPYSKSGNTQRFATWQPQTLPVLVVYLVEHAERPEVLQDNLVCGLVPKRRSAPWKDAFEDGFKWRHDWTCRF